MNIQCSILESSMLGGLQESPLLALNGNEEPNWQQISKTIRFTGAVISIANIASYLAILLTKTDEIMHYISWGKQYVYNWDSFPVFNVADGDVGAYSENRSFVFNNAGNGYRELVLTWIYYPQIPPGLKTNLFYVVGAFVPIHTFPDGVLTSVAVPDDRFNTGLPGSVFKVPFPNIAPYLADGLTGTTEFTEISGYGF